LKNRNFFTNLCRINARRLISAVAALAIAAYLLSKGLNPLEVFVAEFAPAFLIFLDWYLTDCKKKQ
jgi:hypothetical protein